MRKTALISSSHLICYGVAIVAVLGLPPRASQAAEEGQSDTIGPWEIAATFKSDEFDRCSISRKLDDGIVADFVRTDDGLRLVLSSPNWKLDRGKNYPVKINLGSFSFDDEVAAESNSVSIDIKDKKFTQSLRAASALNVIGAGATIKVPLDKSTAAFERLDQCVEKNSRVVQTNPFCGAGSSAVAAGGPEAQEEGCQKHAIPVDEDAADDAKTKIADDAKTTDSIRTADNAKPSTQVRSKTARSHRVPAFLRRVDLFLQGR